MVVLATVAVFAAILGLSRSGVSRDMALLYGGLEGGAAGEVLTALEARGATFEVRGGAIYVLEAERDRLRMSLAGEGLPANGAKGYELLDSLSGFGTTSQMFDAAYWRAKEGELARTIQAAAGIRSARVHVSVPSTRSFNRDRTATASVAVTADDGTLGTARARALRYLVASAVPGLAPEDVTVIDGDGALVGMAEDSPTPGAQSDREEEMRTRLQRLLEARVGPGNAVVELSIATETDSEQIFERTFDPEGRVAVSSEVEERSGTSSDSGSGVTVASNLPDGDAAGADSESSSETTETRELTNYEISETQREILRAPGATRRITVAILVNHVTTEAGDGTAVTEPRSAEELESLEALVASAVGLDPARGDEITIRSMAFEPIEAQGTAAGEVETPGAPLDTMTLVQIGVLAAVALILGLFVIRPILMSDRRRALSGDAPPPALAHDTAGAEAGAPGLPAPAEAEASEADGDFSLDTLPTFDMAMFDDDAEAGGDTSEDLSGLDPVTRLRRLMETRQEETLQLLQSWVEDDDREEVA